MTLDIEWPQVKDILQNKSQELFCTYILTLIYIEL